MSGVWAFLLLVAAVTPGVFMLRARRGPRPGGRHRGDLAARLLSRRRLLVLERELGWTDR